MGTKESKRFEDMWRYLNEIGIYTTEQLKKEINSKPTKKQEKLHTYINTDVKFETFRDILPTLNYYKAFQEQVEHITNEELNKKTKITLKKVEECEKKLKKEEEKQFSVDRVKNCKFNLCRAKFELNLLKQKLNNQGGKEYETPRRFDS